MGAARRASLVTVCCAFLVSSCSAIFALSPPNEPPQYCTVFNHMVKSGGTSIKEQLVRGCLLEGQSEPGLCTSDDTSTPDQCRQALYNSSVVMGYGELLRHPMEKIGRDCDFFTMMRHPISRLVSAFYYCPGDHDPQDRPIKWCGNIEYPASLRTRLVDFALKTKWGYMTYAEMMFGIFCRREFEFCELEYQVKKKPHGMDTPQGREALTKMQRMLLGYKAVGIFEEWDLSMELFNATVKSPVRTWDAAVSLNQGIMPDDRQELLDWALLSPEINVALAADLMLYDFAVSLFKHQTSMFLGRTWL